MYMDDSQRVHIVELALDIMLKRGVRYFRVDDLSQDAGISKRTLYEIFEGKEDIIRQAALLFFESEEAEYNGVGQEASNFIESLVLVLEHVTLKAQDTWRLRDDLKKYYNNIFQEIISIVMDRRLESMVALFNIGVKQGYVRDDIDIRLAIVTMQYLFKTLSENEEDIARRTSVERVDTGRQIITSYLRGLCAMSGIEVMDEYINKNRNK